VRTLEGGHSGASEACKVARRGEASVTGRLQEAEMRPPRDQALVAGRQLLDHQQALGEMTSTLVQAQVLENM
jgi:hypothetical protein